MHTCASSTVVDCSDTTLSCSTWVPGEPRSTVAAGNRRAAGCRRGWWSTAEPADGRSHQRPVTLDQATSPRTAAGSSPSTARRLVAAATDLRQRRMQGPAGALCHRCSTRRLVASRSHGGGRVPGPVGGYRRLRSAYADADLADVRHHDSPGRPGDDPRHPPGAVDDQAEDLHRDVRGARRARARHRVEHHPRRAPRRPGRCPAPRRAARLGLQDAEHVVGTTCSSSSYLVTVAAMLRWRDQGVTMPV